MQANLYVALSNSPPNSIDPSGLLDERVTGNNGGIRFFTDVDPKFNGKWTPKYLSDIRKILDLAFAAITKASIKMDKLYELACNNPLSKPFGKEATETHALFFKFFNGGDKCPDCECIKKVKDSLGKMWKLLSKNQKYADGTPNLRTATG